ncbi:MAG: hypothetical protein AAFY41_17660, partial [Bacteroidota bacterium]
RRTVAIEANGLLRDYNLAPQLGLFYQFGRGLRVEMRAVPYLMNIFSGGGFEEARRRPLALEINLVGRIK